MTDQHRTFALFPYLSSDLKHYVLSFVADAPLEEMPENYPKSSLTHELPVVNKCFLQFSKCDLYWKGAIARQTAREPLLWRKALAQICAGQQQQQQRSVVFARRHNHDNSQEPDQALIERTHQTLGKPTYKYIYEQVVSNHLRFKGPVFCQAGHVQLGHPYELNLKLPGHVTMMEDVLRHHPAQARQGGPIDRDAWLIHANRGPLEHSTPAVLVQILRFERTPNADNAAATVILLPFGHVWLEKLYVQEQGGLHGTDAVVYGQVLKMTRNTAADMNRLARNEALAGVMDLLAVDLFENHHDDMDEEEGDDDSSYGSEEEDEESSTSSYLSFTVNDENFPVWG